MPRNGGRRLMTEMNKPSVRVLLLVGIEWWWTLLDLSANGPSGLVERREKRRRRWRAHHNHHRWNSSSTWNHTAPHIRDDDGDCCWWWKPMLRILILWKLNSQEQEDKKKQAIEKGIQVKHKLALVVFPLFFFFPSSHFTEEVERRTASGIS